jgi:hypothetical protein
MINIGSLITREWLASYQSLAHCVVGGCALSSADEIDRLTGPLLDSFRRFLSATDGTSLCHAWRIYLTVLGFALPERVDRSECDGLRCISFSPVRIFPFSPLLRRLSAYCGWPAVRRRSSGYWLDCSIYLATVSSTRKIIWLSRLSQSL